MNQQILFKATVIEKILGFFTLLDIADNECLTEDDFEKYGFYQPVKEIRPDILKTNENITFPKGEHREKLGYYLISFFQNDYTMLNKISIEKPIQILYSQYKEYRKCEYLKNVPFLDILNKQNSKYHDIIRRISQKELSKLSDVERAITEKHEPFKTKIVPDAYLVESTDLQKKYSFFEYEDSYKSDIVEYLKDKMRNYIILYSQFYAEENYIRAINKQGKITSSYQKFIIDIIYDKNKYKEKDLKNLNVYLKFFYQEFLKEFPEFEMIIKNIDFKISFW